MFKIYHGSFVPDIWEAVFDEGAIKDKEIDLLFHKKV